MIVIDWSVGSAGVDGAEWSLFRKLFQVRDIEFVMFMIFQWEAPKPADTQISHVKRWPRAIIASRADVGAGQCAAYRGVAKCNGAARIGRRLRACDLTVLIQAPLQIAISRCAAP